MNLGKFQPFLNLPVALGFESLLAFLDWLGPGVVLLLLLLVLLLLVVLVVVLQEVATLSDNGS